MFKRVLLSALFSVALAVAGLGVSGKAAAYGCGGFGYGDYGYGDYGTYPAYSHGYGPRASYYGSVPFSYRSSRWDDHHSGHHHHHHHHDNDGFRFSISF